MPCGCQSACGCNVIAGANVNVTRIGDTFIVEAVIPEAEESVGVPTFIQADPPVYADGPYVWHQIDGDTGALITTWIESGI